MARNKLPYPVIPTTAVGSQDACPPVRQPSSMPLEVTLADAATFTLSTYSTPGVYCVQIRETGATCMFGVGVNQSTGATTVVLLCADVIASVGPVVATAFAVSSTAGKTSLEATGTTGLLLRNRSGGSLTYHFSRVV